MSKYAVVFEKTGTGFSAYIPDIDGCVAAASTLDETRRLMQEAMVLHLAWMRRDGDAIPAPSIVEFLDDCEAAVPVLENRAARP